jgi:hypothetical protein
VFSPKLTFDKFLNKDLEIKAKCRDALYEPTALFGDFISEHSEILSQKIGRWSKS